MNFILVTESQPTRIERFVQRKGETEDGTVRQAKTQASDRRFSPRKRRDGQGLIGHPGSQSILTCIVRDTSSTGARIELVAKRSGEKADPYAVPNRMTLVFVTSADQTEVACQVMWRSGKELGLRYVGPFRTYAKAQRKLPERRK